MAQIYPKNSGSLGPCWADDDRFLVNTEMIDKVMESGAAEFIFQMSAATLNIAKAVADLNATRRVRIRVVDSLGNVHKWFNKTITTAITKSGTGTVTNVTTCDIAEGEGVILVATQGTWAAGNTQTVTASAQTILGMSVLAKTNMATITA
jgi:hypothetical protein